MKKILTSIAIIFAVTSTSTCFAMKMDSPFAKPSKPPEFDQIDKNRDQKLSLEEFKAAGLSEGFFKMADKNGDGDVDMEEYRSAAANCC
jgi:hypothetical protein